MDNSLALFLSVLFICISIINVNICISIINVNNRIDDLEKEIEKIKEINLICEETKSSYLIKNDFSEGHIYKEDIKEIEIIGDVE